MLAFRLLPLSLYPVVRHKSCRRLHSNRLPDYFRTCRFPDSRIERYSVDQLLGRHIFQSTGYPAFHIVNAGHGACFPAASPVLIISHKDHIIRINSLLPPVIPDSAAGNRIVVHGKHDPVFPAFDGKFPDKFHKMFSGPLVDLFKVYIQSVNSVIQYLLHQIPDQVLSCRRRGKDRIPVHLFRKIIGERPDLQAHGMRTVYIILRSIADDPAFISGQMEPGRGYDIQPLCICRDFSQRGISGRT